MENAIDISKCTLYRLRTDNNILVAVAENYQRQIHSFIEEYGSLEKTPVSKTVRGTFVERNNSGELQILTGSEQQNDITVNQLVKIA